MALQRPSSSSHADQLRGNTQLPSPQEARRSADPFAIAAVGLLTAFALFQALAQNRFPDFFIYRAGAELVLHRQSPYQLEPIRERVGAQFPDANPNEGDTEQKKEDRLVNNCGFFLPPQAIVAFAPFAAVPYPVAKVLWAMVTGLSAAAVLLLLRTFGTSPPHSLIGRLIPLFLLLNFLTIAIVFIGQTTLLCLGCVAAGQWCFERKWPILGAVLWAIPFLKPHLALPLLPLAWYLGGWKRAAAIAGVVAGLNLAGCLIAGVSPGEYLEFLRSMHGSVAYNRVERNYGITGWNRTLFVVSAWFDRPVAIQQTAWVTLGSYVVWFGLAIGRVAISGKLPSAAWAAAAAMAGAVVCPQVLGYEALMLAVAVPWVRELFVGGWRFRGWAAVIVLGMQAIPIQTLDAVGFTFHAPLGAALFAVLVLVGPLNTRARP